MCIIDAFYHSISFFKSLISLSPSYHNLRYKMQIILVHLDKY